MKIQKTTLAAFCLIGALLLSNGSYGNDWPAWLRGVVLGVLAVGTINFTVGASRTQQQAKRERQDVR